MQGAVSSREGFPPPAPTHGAQAELPNSIECTDLLFSVSHKKGIRCILNELSCVFHGGTLTAVLGPSGCGKTTLMLAISGRMSGHRLKVTVSVNGTIVNPVSNRANIGFVPAHESLFPTDTPREALGFVARLTRPMSPPSQRTEAVRSMIEALRLAGCQETYMGSALLKGVSSGEKKRSSVGMELLPERRVLFLDEPTTGLDAVTAYELVDLLRKLAHEQHVCVVAVIHQPSSKIWELFDNVMFMAQGHVVYHGPVEAVVDYFSSRGYICPSGYSPADYVMFILQTINEPALFTLFEEYRPAMLRLRNEILDRRKFISEHPTEQHLLEPFKRASFGTQFSQLVLREYRSTTRDLTVVGLRVFLALLFSTIIGFLFFQVGTKPGGAGNPSHIGLVAALAIFSISSSGQALLMSYAAERPIALREYGSGFYSIFAYSLSKDVLEIPLVTFAVLVYLTLGYLIGGLQGSFLLLFLGMWLSGISASVISFLLGSVVTSVDIAAAISAYVLVLQILLAGFFVDSSQVPWVLRWLQWVTPLRYGLSIMYIAEFNGQPNSQEFFAANVIDPSMLLFYIFMLIGIILIFRLLAAIGLWLTCRSSTE